MDIMMQQGKQLFTADVFLIQKKKLKRLINGYFVQFLALKPNFL